MKMERIATFSIQLYIIYLQQGWNCPIPWFVQIVPALNRGDQFSHSLLCCTSQRYRFVCVFWAMRQSLMCSCDEGSALTVLTGLHRLGPLSQHPCSVQPRDIIIVSICRMYMFDMIISTHVFTILYVYCWHAEKMTQKIWLIQVLDMYVRLVDTLILLQHEEHIAINCRKCWIN